LGDGSTRDGTVSICDTGMSAPSTGHRSACPLRTALAVGLLMGAVTTLVLVGAFAAMEPARSSLATATLASASSNPAESASCAGLESNSTVNSTYIQAYDAATSGGNGSGAGGSAYPPIEQGESQLFNSWTTVCGSATFQVLLADHGSKAFLSGDQLNGSTGHYQAFYGFAYGAPCAQYPNDTCSVQTAWFIDLATGEISGPITQGGGSPLGAPNGSNGNLGSSASRILTSPWAYLIALAGALTLGILFLAVRRGTRKVREVAPPGGPAPAAGPAASRDSQTDSSVRTVQDAGPDDPLSDVF
jgi:hypothetical protein